MAMTAKLDTKFQMKIVDAYNEGGGYRSISDRFNFQRSTIWSITIKYNEIYCVQNKLNTEENG